MLLNANTTNTKQLSRRGKLPELSRNRPLNTRRNWRLFKWGQMEAHYTTLILQINTSSLTTKWRICLFCATLQPFCGRPIFRRTISPLEYLGGFRIRYDCFISSSLIGTFCFLGMSLSRNLLRFCLRGISASCKSIKRFKSNTVKFRK